jgi:hypothetical protein
MRARLWLKHFEEALLAGRQKYTANKKWEDPEWTTFMREIMEEVAGKINCRLVQLRPGDKQYYSGEYFNLDAVFFDDAEYVNDKDPLVLPSAVVELENNWDKDKIAYCLWKLLCIRSPIRVLVCYQESAKKVEDLKNHLESVVWRGSLMKGIDGDLLVIICDESIGVTKNWQEYFKERFSVFEWRNDRLEKIED